ncbi:hypothetical protein LCGC14_2743880 [marine sediment metagenome]|uniref:Uncharacterized protein n=1 Tax=marine sediment metagenome TaxID=412755 RepID=A0A0F9BCN1_9ZZZZ
MNVIDSILKLEEQINKLNIRITEIVNNTAKTFLTTGIMICRLEKKINDLELKCA